MVDIQYKMETNRLLMGLSAYNGVEFIALFSMFLSDSSQLMLSKNS